MTLAFFKDVSPHFELVSQVPEEGSKIDRCSVRRALVNVEYSAVGYLSVFQKQDPSVAKYSSEKIQRAIDTKEDPWVKSGIFMKLILGQVRDCPPGKNRARVP